MNKEEKEHVIFEAAYSLLQEKGYKSTSMLAIAKKVSASNETLYKWYGNKQGLIAKMISINADPAAKILKEQFASNLNPRELLENIGPALITLTTGEKAILLNRAAAADVSQGALLGKLINKNGRSAIMPLLTKTFQRLIDDKSLIADDAGEVAEVYIALLLGDSQIRRVIGVVGLPNSQAITAHSLRTIDLVYKIYDGN